MEFGPVMRFEKEIFFLKNTAENEVVGLAPGLFLFFEKAICEVKASGLQLSFNKFY